MTVVAAYGLLAHSLIFAALVSLLPLGILRQRAALAATALALLAGIAPVMHGTFGTPSVTLLLLAIYRLSGREPTPLSFQPALGLVIFSLFFYPLALGISSFDPYTLGYQPVGLLTALIPVAAALWWRRQNIWLLILSIDLAAYASGVFANLWDVLLDPLLFLLALIIIGRKGVARLIAARNR